MLEIRPARDDDVDAVFRLDGRLFGEAWKPDDQERQRAVMDLDRFRVAVDDGTMVGTGGSFGLQMTVPGGAAVPTGGVTFIGVAVTHRRRGVLTGLMESLHDDIVRRGEPLAALTASEGGIYERFGYGVATQRRMTLIDRRRVQLAPAFKPEKPVLRTIEWDDPTLPDELEQRWERVRPLRVAEINRTPAWFRLQIGDRGAGATWLLHDDGFACWSLAQHWNEGHPAHELTLLDLAAATPDAHAALWDAVLSADLVGPVRSGAVSLHDPLPYLLRDWRALRTAELNDFVWCLPLDVAACFSARSFGSDDAIVVEADGARWRIGADGCARVRTRPDLVAERAALGPLLMGVAPSALAAGRRLTARTPEILRRADILLATIAAPQGISGF